MFSSKNQRGRLQLVPNGSTKQWYILMGGCISRRVSPLLHFFLPLLPQDTCLVEVQQVQQVVKFAVLFSLRELDVVLLETVQGQLGLVVHVDLHRLWHPNPK